jgi:hypothetical protein
MNKNIPSRASPRPDSLMLPVFYDAFLLLPEYSPHGLQLPALLLATAQH